MKGAWQACVRVRPGMGHIALIVVALPAFTAAEIAACTSASHLSSRMGGITTAASGCSTLDASQCVDTPFHANKPLAQQYSFLVPTESSLHSADGSPGPGPSASHSIFDSVVTVQGRVNIGALHGTLEATSADGAKLWFARDADAGTVTVLSPGDPGIAVLVPAAVPLAEAGTAAGGRPAAVDVPACGGPVYLVARLLPRPPELSAEHRTDAAPAVRLGRRGGALVASSAAVEVLGVEVASDSKRRLLQDNRELGDRRFNLENGPNQPIPRFPVPGPAGTTPLPASVAPAPVAPAVAAAAPPAALAPPLQGNVDDPASISDGGIVNNDTDSADPRPMDSPADALRNSIDELVVPTPAPAIPGSLLPAAADDTNPASDTTSAPAAESGHSDDESMLLPIGIGIAAGLVLFALVAVCFLWYRRSARGRKGQFAVTKRQDGYEYSHAYPPPPGQAAPTPAPPPESHLSVQAHHPYTSQAKPPVPIGYAAAGGPPTSGGLHAAHAHGHHDPQFPPSYGHPALGVNGKDMHVASAAAAAAYASQSAQPPVSSDLAARQAVDSPVSPNSPAMYSPQAPTPTHTPPLPAGEHMEEVNQTVARRALPADSARAPVSASRTAPIMGRKHDSKHAARTHKPHKPAGGKPRKGTHSPAAPPSFGGIAAMHDVPLEEEAHVALDDVIALPIASHGNVDDEIQDKIIWLEAQLDAFGSSGIVNENYKLLPHARITQEASVTQHALGSRDQLAYILTFFLMHGHFEAERALYRMPSLRGIVPRCEIFTDDTALCGPWGDRLPPCIVFERGETLAEWRRRRSPERQVLAEVLVHAALRLRTLHRAGYVHCNIGPSTVKWFPQDNMWKLAEFHHAARAGDLRRGGAPGLADVSPHYAAPESINKSHNGGNSSTSLCPEVTASTALDVWSFGVMATEILGSFRLMDDTKEVPPEVLDQLTGDAPLPWEVGNPSYPMMMDKLGDYKGPLLKALSRDPSQRPSISWITEQWRRVQDSERDPSPTGEFL
eukprot:jgi/Ulvmu1/7108/UM034_0014.1